MLLSDIITQLKIRIPIYTDLFSETVTATSITVVASDVEVITPTAHGLITGDSVHFSGVESLNPISSLTSVDLTATAVTTLEHDLTLGWQSNVLISGTTESEYNGTLALADVQNRKTFSYTLDSTASSPATGSPLFHDSSFNNGYNGYHQITKIDDTTFKYTPINLPGAASGGDLSFKKAIRISGGASIERIISAYTPQTLSDKLWMFCILCDVIANKSRHIKDDATDILSDGDEYRQRVIQHFSVYVFIPSLDNLAARQSRDQAEVLVPIIFKGLLRTRIPSQLEEPQWANVIFEGHRIFNYVGSYYVHVYDFSTTFDIVIEDTAELLETVAFRDLNFECTDRPAEAYVNLDEDPL